MLPALGSPLHQNVLATPAFFADLHLEKFNKPLAVAMYGNARDRLMEELNPVPGIACYRLGGTGRPCLWDSFTVITRPSPILWKSWDRSEAGCILLHCSGQSWSCWVRRPWNFWPTMKIPSLPGQLTHTVNQAVVAAAAFGYPVVLKLISSEYIHKSDQGGVILNLKNEDELTAAFRRLQPLLAAVPQDAAAGILVQKQLQGRELLLGLKQDPTFGPIIVCGYGGTITELWQDTAQTLAPLSPAQAHDLLASLRSFPLLTGYRGEPAVDLEGRNTDSSLTWPTWQ